MYFHVYSFKLQIHAHIYRSFIRHHKMLGVRIAKRKNEPQKPANPCGTKLRARIFFVNTLQKQLNHNASMAEELLRQKMGNSPEAMAAFEAYQLAAGECSSIVAEQAFESGYQTAVQMLVAGLIPPENKFAAEVPLTTQELRKMDGEQVFCLDMNEEVRVVARKKGFIQVTNDKEIHRITGLTLYRHRPSWCQ